jgi:hypothetical protein
VSQKHFLLVDSLAFGKERPSEHCDDGSEECQTVAEGTPVRDRRDNGILQSFRTRTRGTFLILPRELRAPP